MRIHRFTALALLLCSGTALAADRGQGWDFGGELLYQFSQDVNFDGGSSAALDDDMGFSLSFTYRFNSRLEMLFGVDWNSIDYNIDVAPGDAAAGLGFSATGEIEYWTPRLGVNFNVLEGPLTPYVTGGVGWSFIDTNIPDAPPQTACWWDPWWGYYCGTFQSTRTADELTYNLGAGLRWDVSSTLTLRFGYEKHWVDYGAATSTPGFDQLKIGLAGRY